MKRIQTTYRYMESSGQIEHDLEDAILLTPDIAFTFEKGVQMLSLYRVKPSIEGGDLYDVCDYLSEIEVPACTLDDFADMPPETAAFINWLANKVVKERASRPNYVPFVCYA